MQGATSAIAPVVVLRSQAVGDSDLIVSLLSPQTGRFDAHARAARKSKTRFGSGLLRPFVELEVTVAPPRKGQLPQLQSAAMLRDLLGGAPSYPQLCVASYANELAAQAAQPGHADAPLYAWLCAAVTACALAAEATLPRLIAAVLAGFLGATGLLPDLLRCARCDRPLQPAGHWSADAMGLGCTNCAQGAQQWVQAADLQALHAAARQGSAAPLQQVDEATVALLTDRLQRLIDHTVHGQLRSAKALHQLLRPVSGDTLPAQATP